MRTHVARVRMIAVLIFGFHISGTLGFADPLEDGQGRQVVRRSDMSGFGGEAEVRGFCLK